MKKMLRSRLSWSMALLAAGLSACGGGGDTASSRVSTGSQGAFCDSISGGGSKLAADCTGCTVANQGAAVDRNLYSSADIMTATGGINPVATIRATAQAGTVYPAGSKAGTFFTALGNVCDNCGVVINTYLSNTMQESQSGLTNSNGSGSAATTYSAVSTTKPFDAVEVVVTGTVAGGTSGKLAEIYEICSDGGFR